MLSWLMCRPRTCALPPLCPVPTLPASAAKGVKRGGGTVWAGFTSDVQQMATVYPGGWTNEAADHAWRYRN